MKKQITILCTYILLIALAIYGTENNAQATPDNTPSLANQTCATVRALMAANDTPYDRTLTGHEIVPGEVISETLTTESYAGFWVANAIRPTNSSGIAVTGTLQVDFTTITPGLELEVTVFYGMEALPQQHADNGVYHPVLAGADYRYAVRRDGAYTIVVRRADPADDMIGAYAFNADFIAGELLPPLPLLRDESTSSAVIPQALTGGYVTVDMPASVRAHVGAVSSTSTVDGAATQVLLENSQYAFITGNWATDMTLLGGDLAVKGQAADGARLLFIEEYGYQGYQPNRLNNPDLTALRTANDLLSTIDWQAVSGVWLLRDCVGVKLVSGQTFTATIDPATRETAFTGNERAFAMTINALNADNEPTDYALTLDWSAIADDTEVTLYAGLFDASLVRDKQITLESTTIALEQTTRQDTGGPALAVTLADRGASLLLDWLYIETLSLRQNIANDQDEITFTFNDAGRNNTPSIRDGTNLLRFEALDGVIQIVYQPLDGIPGEQRLLLPQSDSYIEIITPAGLPQTDAQALPGTADYTPRALNNLGAECYPINTMLPQANCPPNGYFNPANGNLWYAITDHIAYGSFINLALTRSYNSADYLTDGPFGPGWSTALRLDYSVAFSEASNSRLIDTTHQNFTNYPVGLDLTWAPRGYVTYIAPSGSRHVFATATDNFRAGTLTALTMPGWTLTRTNLRAGWILVQDDGLTYTFDRAGRLISYGYPERDRVITITYPRASLNGPLDAAADGLVFLTDAANSRRIELYYEGLRIQRSILRDISQFEDRLLVDMSQCEPAQTCFETIYRYDDRGYLIGVRYPDGSEATYNYEAVEGNKRLIAHDDPRAPIANHMRYSYGVDGRRSAEIVRADDELTLWQQMRVLADTDDNGVRRVSVIDVYGAERIYTYDLTPSEAKTTGTTFTLLSQTSPLASDDEDADPIEALPIIYTWANGILQSQRARVFENAGRNSINFAYADSGYHPTRISDGLPRFDVTYTTQTIGNNTRYLPQRLSYFDGTEQIINYDPTTGLPTTMNDRFGGEFIYQWYADAHLQSIIDVDDNVQLNYTYNSVGLVNQATQTLVNLTEAENAPYTINTTYDGLGRPVAITATTGDQTLSTQTISYALDQDTHTSSITIADGSSQTITRLDSSGNMIEQAVYPSVGEEYLRRTTYAYNTRRQVIRMTQFLQVPDETQTETTSETTTLTETEIVTQYTYQPTPILVSAINGIADAEIYGYSLSIIDPGGRVSVYTYDALQRLRQITMPGGRLTRYDYSYEDLTQVERLGLKIIQRDALNGQLVDTTEYEFDLRRQWKAITLHVGDDNQLEVNITDENNNQFNSLEAGGAWTSVWDDGINPAYTGGRPNQVNFTGTQAALSAQYDQSGRPREVQTADGTRYALAYCALPGGMIQTRYFEINADTDTQPGCDNASAQRIITHDALGRLQSAKGAGTTRIYTYTQTPSGWDVAVDFNSQTLWNLRYNSLGELVYADDENGTQRRYTYDTLGRLIDLDTLLADGTAQPEASFTYSYNALGLLTSALDKLGSGRGSRYDYDNLGRLTVQQDARTADATIYAYNADGMLATVISPLGNTTNYLYEDPADPTRLTAIIDPTGSTVRFDWEDSRESNTFIYTDGRGNVTRYIFNRFGALRRIEEPLASEGEREHTLAYDPAGRLSGWQQISAADNVVRDLLLNYTQSNAVTISSATIDETTLDWSRTLTMSSWGQLSDITDQNGVGLRFIYDTLGRLTAARTSSQSWDFAYAANIPQMTYTSTDTPPYTITFDAVDRVQTIIHQDTTQTLAYTNSSIADLNIAVSNTVDETDYVLTYATGNEAARPTEIIVRAPGQRVQYVYNDEGLLTEIRRTACITPPLEETATTPDDATTLPDRCVSINTDEQPKWTVNQRMEYDTLGRPVRFIDAEQNVETFAYDEAGNLIDYQDITGRAFGYAYDSRNRLSHITGPTGIRLLLDYAGRDEVTAICRTRSENASTFDACAQNPANVLESYTYDVLGRLTARRFGAGEDAPVTHYTYADGSGAITGWQLPVENANNLATITRNPDLNQLTNLTLPDTEYTFSYDGQNRLTEQTISGQPNIRYTYDDLGRIDAVILGDSERLLTYDYASQGGYALRDGEQRVLLYALDENGFLSALNPASTTANITYNLDSNGRDITASIPFLTEDASRASIRLNRNTIPQQVDYLADDLFIEYVTAPNGQVRRQNLNSRGSAYFIDDYTRFIIVTGYDNDGRPLTLRVSDGNGGDLLYLLAFTYDGTGRLSTETRRYRDDTQVSIIYQYDATNSTRLIGRRINIVGLEPSVTESASMNGGPLALLLALMAWFMRVPARRRTLLVLFIVGATVIFALSFVGVGAQRSSDTYIQSISYDNAGRLQQINQIAPDSDREVRPCYSYDYDAAGRLIEWRDNRLDTSHAYAYDARNRLIAIDTDGDQQNLIYHGSSQQLLGVVGMDGEARFFGQPAGSSPLFVQEEDTIQKFIGDGRTSPLVDETPQPLWLFDPYGRFLTLNAPDRTALEDCILTSSSPALDAYAPLQIFADGLIWDDTSNLFFGAGRAYNPEIARFLQRDPLGPDIFGGLYTYPARAGQPPVRQRQPTYIDGLSRLRTALQTLETSRQLSSGDVIIQHLPRPTLTQIEPLLADLDRITATTLEEQLTQLDLPVWLANQYNLYSAYVDQSGALRLPNDEIMAQGGLERPYIGAESVFYDPMADWLPQIMPTLARTQSLFNHSQPVTNPAFTLYQPFNWQPSAPQISRTWASSTPPFDLSTRPDALIDRLPQPLKNPAAGAVTLDALLHLDSLPYDTGLTWLQTAIDAVLPALPPDLPNGRDEWLASWFTQDTLGVAAMLSTTQPAPPTVDVPVYRYGPNQNWRPPQIP